MIVLPRRTMLVLFQICVLNVQNNAEAAVVHAGPAADLPGAERRHGGERRADRDHVQRAPQRRLPLTGQRGQIFAKVVTLKKKKRTF